MIKKNPEIFKIRGFRNNFDRFKKFFKYKLKKK
jgi:hypothetical protein